MTSSSSKLLQIQGKWQQERSPTKKAKPYQKKVFFTLALSKKIGQNHSKSSGLPSFLWTTL
jgi:hypothetical protein